MFTGIIESLGIVKEIQERNGTLLLDIESSITDELKVDQSVAHNGICLTVTNIHNNRYSICAVHETIEKTTIANWLIGDEINLERCLSLNGRIDGHIVQGHVDTKAECVYSSQQGENRNYRFLFDKKFASLIIEKGSICVNGVSLTCFNISESEFEVTIIPYTYQHTIFKNLNLHQYVNLEFDLIGKYINRFQSLKSNDSA